MLRIRNAVYINVLFNYLLFIHFDYKPSLVFKYKPPQSGTLGLSQEIEPCTMDITLFPLSIELLLMLCAASWCDGVAAVGGADQFHGAGERPQGGQDRGQTGGQV